MENETMMQSTQAESGFDGGYTEPGNAGPDEAGADTGAAGAPGEAGGQDNSTENPAEGEQSAPGEAKPWKNEENAQAAQRRRQNEAAQRERLFREMTNGLNDPRTGQPFASEEDWRRWKQDMALRASAQKAGVEEKAARTLVEDMRQTLLKTDPEYQRMAAEAQAARSAMAQQAFADDLKAIKKAYPDEKAKSVIELGPEFMAMMATGRVSAVAAYEAVRAERNRTAPKPPSTGGIQGSGAKGKGGVYTREEVERMTPAQINEHLDDIRKSMSGWR